MSTIHFIQLSFLLLLLSSVLTQLNLNKATNGSYLNSENILRKTPIAIRAEQMVNLGSFSIITLNLYTITVVVIGIIGQMYYFQYPIYLFLSGILFALFFSQYYHVILSRIEDNKIVKGMNLVDIEKEIEGKMSKVFFDKISKRKLKKIELIELTDLSSLPSKVIADDTCKYYYSMSDDAFGLSLPTFYEKCSIGSKNFTRIVHSGIDPIFKSMNSSIGSGKSILKKAYIEPLIVTLVLFISCIQYIPGN